MSSIVNSVLIIVKIEIIDVSPHMTITRRYS